MILFSLPSDMIFVLIRFSMGGRIELLLNNQMFILNVTIFPILQPLQKLQKTEHILINKKIYDFVLFIHEYMHCKYKN